MTDRKTFECPVPTMAPLGVELDRDAVREVWDTFVKPGQDRGDLQSIEDRALMAILRAVYEGLPPTEKEDWTRG